jgi:cytochrome c556
MKRHLLVFGLTAMIVTAPAALTAASTIRSIMHEWKSDTRDMDDMLAGQAPFDQAALHRALQGFVADASRLDTAIKARDASAQDLKRRFAAFRAVAQAAIGDISQLAVLKEDVSRLKSNCQSCHNAFKD